jgi:hypothetical protein
MHELQIYLLGNGAIGADEYNIILMVQLKMEGLPSILYSLRQNQFFGKIHDVF